jgi:hypothetical protein
MENSPEAMQDLVDIFRWISVPRFPRPRLLLEYYREKDVVVLVTKSVAGTIEIAADTTGETKG